MATGKKIGVGVVGANLAGGLGGSWGVAAHLPALLSNPDFDVVAVATTRQETAQETADKFGIAKAYGSAAELAADPAVQLVSVCTRVGTHRELIGEALKAGKDVFCEWPLGVSLDDAEQIEAKARKAGVRTMIGLQTRRAPAFAEARRIIDAGEIGDVLACQVMHSGAWSTVMPQANAYFQLDESGGNFTTIRGAHTLDGLITLAGEFESLSAIGQTVCPDVTIYETGEAMTRTCWDQMSVQGRSVSGAMVSLQLHGGPADAAGIRVEVSGSKGGLLIEGAAQRGIQMADLSLTRIAPDGTRQSVELQTDEGPAGAMMGNVARAYQEFAKAYREARTPSPGFSDAVTLHRIVDAIARSASSGERIFLG